MIWSKHFPLKILPLSIYKRVSHLLIEDMFEVFLHGPVPVVLAVVSLGCVPIDPSSLKTHSPRRWWAAEKYRLNQEGHRSGQPRQRGEGDKWRRVGPDATPMEVTIDGRPTGAGRGRFEDATWPSPLGRVSEKNARGCLSLSQSVALSPRRLNHINGSSDAGTRGRRDSQQKGQRGAMG